MRRAFVSLPDGIWKIIDQNFRGPLGDGDSEIIRNMVISYISEQGFFINREGGSPVQDIYTQLNIVATMITELVNALEEKNIIRYSDWDARIKKKIATDVTDIGKNR